MFNGKETVRKLGFDGKFQLGIRFWDSNFLENIQGTFGDQTNGTI